MADYRQQAMQQFDPSYNAKVNAIKNNLAQQTLNLNNSKTGINQNYDTQVANQNLMNTKGKNNFSNTMLGRGLGRSSIVGTGLAEQDQINNRLVGNINTARTGALGNVDSQIALLGNNTSNTLTQMAGDRESEIMALARSLEDRDTEKNFKAQQLDMQRQAQAAEAQYRRQQMAMQSQAQAWQREQAMAELALKRQQMEEEKKLKNNADDDKLAPDMVLLNDVLNSNDVINYKGEKFASTLDNKVNIVNQLAKMYNGVSGSAYDGYRNYANSRLQDLIGQQSQANRIKSQIPDEVYRAFGSYSPFIGVR